MPSTKPDPEYTHRIVLESHIEHYFKNKVAAAGAMTEKHVSPGKRGVPDQLVTWPNGWMELVELKRPAPDSEAASHQIRDHERRAFCGVTVALLYTPEDVDAFVNGWKVRWRVNGPTALM